MSIAIITGQSCPKHNMGEGHPERPERLHSINDQLVASGLDEVLIHEEARVADRESLYHSHDARYVDQIFDVDPGDSLVWIDGDTAMNQYSLQASREAAGASMQAVDLVMAGQADQVFCAVRPPGHHAEHDRAMGFCLFNNVSTAAFHALNRHDVERVAIVDFDVHHGNGTEDIVSGDERILFCSSFQHPFYPGTGAGVTADNVLNLPLPANTDGSAYRDATAQRWFAALENFSPDLILFSAGFDAHREDPLAQLNLVEDDFAWITREICAIADRTAQGRVISCLEGGYNLSALARSVDAHLRVFLE